eukprot:gene12973-17397_t
MLKNTFLLVIISIIICSDAEWFAYDNDKKVSGNCSIIQGNTGPITKKEIDDFKLWPDLFTNHDAEKGETMFGFREAISKVWHHQHPADCSKAKFLVTDGWIGGFGSETHVLGVGLAIAMNLNRIFIRRIEPLKRSKRSAFQFDNEFCRNQSKVTLDCYYELWSNCSWSDVSSKDKGNRIFTSRWKEEGHRAINDVMLTLVQENAEANTIPDIFRQLVDCSPMHVNKYRYWWRAVSAAYILRPNQATLQLMKQYRNSPTLSIDRNSEEC